MKRALFICNTTYQVVVAIQLRITNFKQWNSDLIITDTVPNFIEICNKIFELKLFDAIIPLQEKKLNYNSNRLINFDTYFKKYVFINKELKRIITEKDRYDYYLFANITRFSPRLGKLLSKFSPSVKFAMYEDGVSSYSRIYGDRINQVMHPNSIIKKLGYKVFPSVISKLNDYFVFEPRYIVWECDCARRISTIESNLDEIRQILNCLYGYQHIKDNYNEKVIFFEESYYEDGIQTGDLELVEGLAEIYGKNQIFIKTHPRNKVNRFETLGFHTNKDKTIPWEVIALNISLEDKLLVTMTSTAVVNSFILLHTSASLILEYRNLNFINERIEKTVEVIEKIKEINPTIFSHFDMKEK